MNMIRELGHFCEESLRDLDLFSLKKKTLQIDLLVPFQYLEEAYKRAGQGHFMKAWSERTRRG